MYLLATCEVIVCALKPNPAGLTVAKTQVTGTFTVWRAVTTAVGCAGT